jgi:hypothetical protein
MKTLESTCKQLRARVRELEEELHVSLHLYLYACTQTIHVYLHSFRLVFPLHLLVRVRLLRKWSVVDH